jgi:hypothetical protein
MVKSFDEEIYFFLDKIVNKENFALPRYSDGELYMLQRRSIHLHENKNYVEGSHNNIQPRPAYDTKHFDSSEHTDFIEHLIEAFSHKQDNYYKGICCRCCVGEDDFKWQFKFLSDDDNLTWANVFLNSNYPFFMSKVLPEIKKRKAVYVCNEHANLKNEDWIIKDFRITSNQAFITDVGVIDKIGDYIESNNIKDTLFLFSASALSNLAIYELYKKYPNNTYLDIGTTINKSIGIPVARGYLDQWDLNGFNGTYKKCLW